MNYPVGTVITKGPTPFSFTDIFYKLSSKKFNGYLVLSIFDNFIEEGCIFFRDGLIVGSVVECLALKKSLKGDESLSYFFNQTKGKGFFQVVELTRSQVDLINAFDEKLLFSSIPLGADIEKLIPNSFNTKFSMVAETKNPLEEYGFETMV
jgi:hypothetical protein